MRILLLRHGQSESNLVGRIQGHDDPLTPLGREQAGLLQAKLQADYTIDHVISSSLLRARQTADIALNPFGLETMLEPRFAEIFAGNAIGMLWDDWAAANPELAAVWTWDVRHADAAWEEGESGRDLCRRVFAAWDELIDRNRHIDQTFAIVTHGGVIAWLAARLNGDSLEYWPAPYGDIANCSITEVSVNSAGRARIDRWNITDHLKEAYRPHITPIIPHTDDTQGTA